MYLLMTAASPTSALPGPAAALPPPPRLAPHHQGRGAGVEADTRGQLGAAQAGLHRGPAGGAHRPSGVSELLRLISAGGKQS